MSVPKMPNKRILCPEIGDKKGNETVRQKTIALKKPGVLRTASFLCYLGQKLVLADSPKSVLAAIYSGSS